MTHLIASQNFFARISPADVQLLSSRGWLSNRSPGFRRALLSLAVPRSFATDQALYRHGDPADGLYGICEGAVRIAMPADNGQEFEAHRDSAGFWIGDLAHFSGETRLVSVVAVSPVRAAFIPAQRIQELTSATPDFVQDFYALSYQNSATALRLLANLSVAQTDARLCLRLLHLDETLADEDRWIALSQAELAAMIAVSMPTLQRALRRLAESGVVEIGYGRLRLLDRAALIAQGQI